MPQLLSLSRAARLIGVTRAALQQRIKGGELRSFDGMVSMDDLLAAYPDTRLEESTVLERLARLQDEAFSRRVRERTLPGAELLAERLFEQTRELADLRAHLQRYHELTLRLRERIRAEPGEAMARLGALLDGELAAVLGSGAPAHALAVMDDMLRLMAAHVVIRPSGHEFFVEGADSILDAALKSGLALNFGCSAGNCGLCKARVVSGQLKPLRHHDYALSEAEKQQGYALLCSNTALTDLVVEALEAAGPGDIPQQEVATRVKAVEPLGAEVMLLHLQTPRSTRLRFLAGQSVTLGAPGGGSAEFPVASCPCDDRNLQFHIARNQENRFAAHVFARGLKPGDTVTVWGPWGEFVLREGRKRPLLFLACDTGFAPVKSLIEHAMALDEPEPIHLYWLASGAEGHYLANLCRAWAEALDNFRYTPLAPEGVEWEACAGAAVASIARGHAGLGGYDAYVAGPVRFVHSAAAQLMARGLPEGQLFALPL